MSSSNPAPNKVAAQAVCLDGYVVKATEITSIGPVVKTAQTARPGSVQTFTFSAFVDDIKYVHKGDNQEEVEQYRQEVIQAVWPEKVLKPNKSSATY